MQKYCGTCKRIVYHAEQVNAAGGFYHNSCFVCANMECGRRLDSRSCNQHANKLYCNFCYKDQFGPSGIGFGGLCIRKHTENQPPKPVNSTEIKQISGEFPSTQHEAINSFRFYGNQPNACHQFQQIDERKIQPNQQLNKDPVYTPILRTWYH